MHGYVLVCTGTSFNCISRYMQVRRGTKRYMQEGDSVHTITYWYTLVYEKDRSWRRLEAVG